MFSNLAAASVPTTESDLLPIPIIKNKDTKKKKKENTKKDKDIRFIPAHKFTAAMQQQDDLNSNIALYQEASGKFDATTMAKKFSGRFDITHAPGHKATYGLAFSADKESKVQIFGGTNDNTGSIQSIFLGSGRTKGKEKKYVTIFNVYAPTAPTHTPANLVRYHAWLSELVKEVHKAKAAGCAVYIIGDFNVAPDPTMDRNLTGKTATPNPAETLLWMQITSSLQMADAFRARHPNTTAMTHVKKR